MTKEPTPEPQRGAFSVDGPHEDLRVRLAEFPVSSSSGPLVRMAAGHRLPFVAVAQVQGATRTWLTEARQLLLSLLSAKDPLLDFRSRDR